MPFTNEDANTLGQLEQYMKNGVTQQARVESVMGRVEKRMNDHETRITVIETSRSSIWKTLTIVAGVIMVVGGGMFAFIKFLINLSEMS